MRNAANTFSLVALLAAAALAVGCGSEPSGEASGEAELPLPNVDRPVLSDEHPATPYTAETARDVGQADAPGVSARNAAGARANRPARPQAGDAGLMLEADLEAVPLTTVDQAAAAAGEEGVGPPTADSSTDPRLDVVNTIVAEVNGEIITREDLLRDIRELTPLWRKTYTKREFEARIRMELRNRLRGEISRRLVLQKAREDLAEQHEAVVAREVDKARQRAITRHGGSVAAWHEALAESGTTEEAWREQQTNQIIVRSYLNSQLGPKITVTRSEMVEHYHKLRGSRYTLEPKAHLKLIKLSLRDHADREAMLALARSLVARARGGEDFAELARRFSTGPLAESGGDWGMLDKGSFRIDAIDEALFTLPVGSVSDPIEIGAAVYLVKVADRQDRRVVPFTEAQEEIRAEVREARYQELVAEYINGLYENAYVRIHTENL